MAYRIVELDLSEKWMCQGDAPFAVLSPEETGLCVIYRYDGCPIGMVLQPLSPATSVSHRQVAAWLPVEAATAAVREKLRLQLVPTASTAGAPSVTAVICTKDRPERLARCLTSLDRQRRQFGSEGLELEILVVDNAPSTDATKQVVKAMEHVQYVVEPLPGLNFARNRGWQTARTDVVAYLDDDVVVDRHWLAGLRSAWLEHPQTAAVTGLVLPFELRTEAQILFEKRGGFGRGFSRRVFTSGSDSENALYPCNTGEFGVGCNMAFRRSALRAIGGFDEALDTGSPLPGGGDHDILYRVLRHDETIVYEPRCVVFHEHRETLTQLSKQYWTWGTSFLAFAAKCHAYDVPLRARWRRCIFYWFASSATRTGRGLLGLESVPGRMLLSEFAGGIVGLMGEYRRSERRVAKRRIIERNRLA